MRGSTVRLFRSSTSPMSSLPRAFLRGEQRRLYDQRKARLAREHGYIVVRIATASMSGSGRTHGPERELDLRTISAALGTAGVRTIRK